MKEIYFAGGCFWGTEHYLKQIRGVVTTEVGYANGNGENPTYEEVYTDTTGFAECVKICYDSDVVELRLLLEMFFRSIDPTSLNRQGNDVGTRYRTGIYYTSTDDIATVSHLLYGSCYDFILQRVVKKNKIIGKATYTNPQIFIICRCILCVYQVFF